MGPRAGPAAQEVSLQVEEILTDNGVRAQGSADTLAVWNTPKVQ
jgi:hypothetical protein